MGQPTPPGDMPLFEGLGTEWNDIVGALPEDRRAELAPKIKERLDTYEPLKQYEEFHKSGIEPDHVKVALDVFSMIENNPRQVYDVIAQHLGISKQEAKEIVEEVQESAVDGEDPRLQTLQQQVDTLTQIALAKRQQETEDQLNAQVEADLDRELKALNKKYNDVDEEEIVMRMMQNNISAEEAYQQYAAKVAAIRSTRPSPMLMGGSGAIPKKDINPVTLNGKDTRELVAQMMQQSMHQR